MQLVRYRRGNAPAEVGLHLGERIVPLYGHDSLASLWALELDQLRAHLDREASKEGFPVHEATLLAPVDGRTEVWASGVTYETSREARVEESEHAADIYRLVYDADRPELFFKSTAWKVAGTKAPIAIREDSTLDVPEPELAVVVNGRGHIVGYTICNDVSSRSIEGDNPLYLPQAKIYLGSCALGPGIRPADEIPDPYTLTIELTIERDKVTVWHGTASTRQLHRKLEDLTEHLYRADCHPDGAVLSTGTCLVPPAPFSLLEADVVHVRIDGLGMLTNTVVRGVQAMRSALMDSGDLPEAQPAESRSPQRRQGDLP